MSSKHQWALRVAALALPALLIAGGALARDGVRSIPANEDRTTGSGGGFYDDPVLPQAPVGHRQPRAADMPAMSPNEEDRWLNDVNRETDRKLQICRGC
jgi:hypothetical protein